ncbi:uncharacterized protein EAF02_004164 [Botrytis sinoallii]|uniref:uncharacterized protein n=1 Tax=Botrytis sinoallii TaxID=1463999 RepID=UPI0019025AAF|nr:uncharacterized protein EAF02_004164 [Botrytis sinoallii]KAF7885655.1 hypothetical protein EAF02_004164 [Botrytis sinoallii]
MSRLFNSVLFVSLLLSVVHAAAVVTTSAGGFMSKCDASTFKFYDDIELGPAPQFTFTITPILSGLCPDSSGHMSNSTLNLNTCLGNNDAHLVWQRNGMFQNSCGCSLQMPNLCCGCGKANGGTVPSGVCVDLNKGIATSGGKLNCDSLPGN